MKETPLITLLHTASHVKCKVSFIVICNLNFGKTEIRVFRVFMNKYRVTHQNLRTSVITGNCFFQIMNVHLYIKSKYIRIFSANKPLFIGGGGIKFVSSKSSSPQDVNGHI
jgi:hypothetical protein